MVKTEAGLSRPIPVQREISQGCPISGQLCSPAIAPLLCTLRDRLSGLSSPGFSQLDHTQTVSAHADDTDIFVTSQADVICLESILSLHTTTG